MAEDASLDQFLGESATDGRSGDDGETDDTGRSGDGTDEPGDGDPAESVYRFDPCGAACASCGAECTNRWRDGETFVCRSCKSW